MIIFELVKPEITELTLAVGELEYAIICLDTVDRIMDGRWSKKALALHEMTRNTLQSKLNSLKGNKTHDE